MAPRLAHAHNSVAWNAFLEVALKGKPPNTLSQVLPDAEKAVSLAPDNVNILDTRGQILLALNRIDAAFADLDMAVRMGIEASVTFYGRGRCHELRGNRDAAVADYRKALELPAQDDYGKHAQAEARKRLAEFGALPNGGSNSK